MSPAFHSQCCREEKEQRREERGESGGGNWGEQLLQNNIGFNIFESCQHRENLMYCPRMLSYGCWNVNVQSTFVGHDQCPVPVNP